MRYVIETNAEQAREWGVTLQRAAEKGELRILEKSDPALELEHKLAQVANALNTLKKVGYNSAVMKSYLRDTTKLSMRDIDAILKGQMDFFKQIGAVR